VRTLTSTDLAKAHIPEKYWDATLSKVPDTAPFKAHVANYLRNLREGVAQGGGVYLWASKNGTGKTALACVIAKHALRLGFTAHYVMSSDVPDLAIQRPAYDDHTTIPERMRAVDVLVLDDFLKEHKGKSGFVEAELEKLIRDRTQRQKVTVFTSNVEFAKVAEQSTVDVASLLAEAAVPIEVVGEDRGGRNWRRERQQQLRGLFKGEA
jgi:DNA replication protein DnaC